MTDPIHHARLAAFIERIERVSDDIADSKIDLKGIYDEAKSEGFDAAIMRKIVARRKDEQKTREQDEMIELYEAALDGKARRKRDERQIDIEDAIGAAA